MQNIKEIKIGRYLIKVGEFPNGFRFNIFLMTNHSSAKVLKPLKQKR